ncbi:MAG: Stk1 family PASTA domain-containing Ser/Thr kinase [Acutalibacteraceae bacterium]|nr:Stk1 family PASTA domain-containing Ser/Thr kinase [Acutalibacteraceae bacterium]
MDNYTGKRLDGRYEIQEVIGVGGMAVVYKAYDNIDDRTVAVKILKEEFLANEEFRRRFKNESKAIAVLSHPNIVKVFNVSYGDRLQYIVMEYVEGITLKEYIEQQGKLGIKETVHFTMQILRALQHAHDKGIVHRDIKPQNIMLLSNGNIKVTDFGIARFSYSDTKTMTDSAIGSVHYISPEQARGDTTDDRADIYSVGVVLYEMLTGQLPFQSDNSVSVALMQLQTDPKRPRELNSSIPVGLEQIVMHAMQKNTKNRYQSAAEMLLDIEEFKRNPTIRFQRDYFVDNDPTKYVPTKKPVAPPQVMPVAPIKPPVAPMPPQPPQQPPYNANPQQNAPKKPAEKKSGSIVGHIIGGVSIGLVSILLFGFLGLYFFVPGLFKGDKLIVPEFKGLNYEEDIKNNPEYAEFEFVIINETSSTSHENGYVLNQKPSKNQKVEKNDNRIELTIVSNPQRLVIPEVIGKSYELAQKTLESKGFNNVKLMPMPSTGRYGDVIKVEPNVGEEANSDSLVVIYYASDEDHVEVPDVVIDGWDVEMARLFIESVHLVMNPEILEEDSDKPAGTVIAQSPAAGEKVLPGTEVQITISNGIAPEGEAEIEIMLPSSGSTRGTFEVFVNNESSGNKVLLMDGTSYKFNVIGSGANASVKVFINGREYYTCTVDFTQSPAVVLHENYSQGSSKKAIPNVVGLSLEGAISQLEANGFKNYVVEQRIVYSESENGIVLTQSPEASSSSIIGITQTYPLTTQITLVVGQKEGI